MHCAQPDPAGFECTLLIKAECHCAAAVDSGVKGVRVFQMDHQHSKRIFAEVKIHASIEQVWRVITDYDHLADFVPNLVTSERLPASIPGRIHLRQLGCSQSVFWRLEAEAVLECVEVQKAMGAKELRFKAIEGDFQASIVACLLCSYCLTRCISVTDVCSIIEQQRPSCILLHNEVMYEDCVIHAILHAVYQQNHMSRLTPMLSQLDACLDASAGVQWVLGCGVRSISSHNDSPEVRDQSTAQAVHSISHCHMCCQGRPASKHDGHGQES